MRRRALWMFVLLAAAAPAMPLAGAANNPANVAGSPHGLQLALRRVYRGVLWLSCVYYWLSLPMVLLLVLAVGGGILYAVFAFGHIPSRQWWGGRASGQRLAPGSGSRPPCYTSPSNGRLRLD